MSANQASANQPDNFEFTEQNLAWAKEQISKYPDGKQASATIPLLWRAQEQNDGWLPQPAIPYIANLLGMAPIRVMEVATFYTMFSMAPVGKFFIQLCGTTPCLLRGSDELVEVLKKRIGGQNHVTRDGLFSWLEVECLGACANAPMVQINKDYFEDLNAENFGKLLDDLEAGRDVTPGPQNGRSCSCPEGGATSLTDASLYSGKEDVESAKIAAVSASSLSNTAQHGGSSTSAPATKLQSKNSSQTVVKNEGGKGLDELESEIQAVEDRAKSTQNSLSTAKDAPTAPDNARTDDLKPKGLSQARDGKADDLKQISGVGPKLEKTLNNLGIFHFDQIAVWNAGNVFWVDDYLSFKGRIDREDWISQAQTLATALSDKKGDA